MQNLSSRSRIPIGSVTAAQKAERILKKAQISAKAVKISEAGSQKGCVYGLEIENLAFKSAMKVLESWGYDTKRYQ